jgi:dolichol-phosphate hexosyltransferase
MPKEKLAVLIPCYNEEKGIAKVIADIPHHALDTYGLEAKVIVIDNNSSDATAKIAKSNGAQVVFEPKKGKGNAMRKGFSSIDSDTAYVVMLDGDNTYKAGEMLRMIEPIRNNFCDVVVGSRLCGKINKNALKTRNRLANRAYTSLVRHFYEANITDVLSGYFAWRGDVVIGVRDYLQSDGFSIEMEMISKLIKLSYSIYSVPITYNAREGETKLEAVKDGLKILSTFSRNLFWSPSQEVLAKENIDLTTATEERETVKASRYRSS